MAKETFDEKNTLCLTDLRELDEIHGDILSLRGRLEKFIVTNPQLSWHDVGFISNVDSALDTASSRLSSVCSLLRNRVYSRGFSAFPRFDEEFQQSDDEM